MSSTDVADVVVMTEKNIMTSKDSSPVPSSKMLHPTPTEEADTVHKPRHTHVQRGIVPEVASCVCPSASQSPKH